MHVNDVVIIGGIKRAPSDGFAKLTLASVVAPRKFLKCFFFFYHSASAKVGGKGRGGGAAWEDVVGRGET